MNTSHIVGRTYILLAKVGSYAEKNWQVTNQNGFLRREELTSTKSMLASQLGLQHSYLVWNWLPNSDCVLVRLTSPLTSLTTQWWLFASLIPIPHSFPQLMSLTASNPFHILLSQLKKSAAPTSSLHAALTQTWRLRLLGIKASDNPQMAGIFLREADDI